MRTAEKRASARVRTRAGARSTRSSSEKLDALFSQGPIRLQYRPREPSSVGSRGMRCRTSMPPCQWPANGLPMACCIVIAGRTDISIRKESSARSGDVFWVLAFGVGGKVGRGPDETTEHSNHTQVAQHWRDLRLWPAIVSMQNPKIPPAWSGFPKLVVPDVVFCCFFLYVLLFVCVSYLSDYI